MPDVVGIIANRDLLVFEFWMIEKDMLFGPVKQVVDLDSFAWDKLGCSFSGARRRKLEKILIILNPLVRTRPKVEQSHLKGLLWRLSKGRVFCRIVDLIGPVAKLCIQRAQRPDRLFTRIDRLGDLAYVFHDLGVSRQGMEKSGVCGMEESLDHGTKARFGLGARSFAALIASE